MYVLLLEESYKEKKIKIIHESSYTKRKPLLGLILFMSVHIQYILLYPNRYIRTKSSGWDV